LKIIRKYSAKTRSSPLDFIFDTCASASSSHCFVVGEAEHIYVSFFWDKYIFSKKTHVLQFGCALTQLFLNLFLMSDFCKFSIIIITSPFPKIKILVPNLLKSCQEPYPLKQSWDIYSWCLTYIYVLVNFPPHENYFPVAGHLYTTGKEFWNILNQNYFPGFERTHGCSLCNQW
jgi:hypothetical protein